MRDGVVDSQVIAHRDCRVSSVVWVRSLNFQREQLSGTDFLDSLQPTFVNQISDYGLSFGIAGLRFVGYDYFN
jgi:hypothetical protein